MRRAVLMTRQAISPRLAIRIRLNMFFLLDLLGGILSCNLACGDGGNNSVVQQNQTEATVQTGYVIIFLRFSPNTITLNWQGRRAT
jgi:hypothetical protein